MEATSRIASAVILHYSRGRTDPLLGQRLVLLILPHLVKTGGSSYSCGGHDATAQEEREGGCRKTAAAPDNDPGLVMVEMENIWDVWVGADDS